MAEMIGGVTLRTFGPESVRMYNEGDEVEEFILSVLKSGQDVREVLAQDNRWPVLYQLSPERANIVSPMDIRPEDRVLEIGAGMGAVTGAIASRCEQVDCVELSMRRSLANAYRNQGYGNIHIYVGNFQAFQPAGTYDVVLLIGVFEYAQSYIDGDAPYAAMLARVRSMLKPGGRLYIAIENRLGMKYLAGCVEDHLGRSFAGIEGYATADPVRTFTKSELRGMLLGSGFSSIYFYYPFPDYKLPVAIYSDDYLPPSLDRSAAKRANYDQDRFFCFDDAAAYETLASTDERAAFANSFLIEAVN